MRRGCGRRRSRRRRRAGRAPQRLATVAMSTPCRSAMRAQRAQQLLEQVPAAEIVDDQLVFDERAVLERRPAARARRASGRPGSRPPPCRSRAAQTPCARAERGEAVLRPLVEQRILHLHATISGTPASRIARDMRRVEIGAAEMADLAGAPHLVEPAKRLEPAPAARSPTSGTARGRAARPAAAAASGRRCPRR